MKAKLKISLIIFLTVIQSAAYSIVFTTTQAGGNSSKDLTVQAGKQYQLKFDLQHQTTSAVRIQIVEGSTTVIDETNLIDGTHVFSFTPTINTVTLKFIREDADNLSRDFEVDNLVYEEISQVTQVESNHKIGRKEYELSDHLGNVRAVVSDKKVNGNIEVVLATDYLPYGMTARNYTNGSLARYGFNGQEKDDEIAQGIYTAEFWEYDSRLGKRWNTDPVVKPWESSYACFNNNPINMVDPNGDDAKPNEEVKAIAQNAVKPNASELEKPDFGITSTDVVKNENGTYTVVGAANDGDNNIYVQGADGKRTEEVIGQTENPWDFMNTNDATGTFEGFAPVTFDLKNLPNGTAKLSELTSKWRLQVVLMANSPLALLALANKSKLGGSYDLKNQYAKSTGGQYTAVSYNGKITTARNLGNILFGQNLRIINQSVLDQLLVPATTFYKTTMPTVGAYNQRSNTGNGYNAGWPFYGEHTYSGTGVYQGYFGIKP